MNSKENANGTFRIAKIFLIFAVSLLVLAVVLILAIQLREEQRAAALLNEIRLLRVGESSANDIDHLVAEYKGGIAEVSGLACDPHGPSFIVGIANDTLNDILRRFSALRGIPHRSTVRAIFILKNGKLCYVQYSVETMPYRALPVRRIADVTLASETQLPPFHVGFTGGNVRTFEAALTSGATPEQHQHAFDFDLSCLARFSGCREACELMPSAWLEYQKKARREGLTPPSDELNDPHCRILSD